MMDAKNRKGTRTGYTTGACSAAAARAATLGLTTGSVPATVECLLPNGQRVGFAIVDGRCGGGQAHAVVIKDAGDDPDCTHGARMTADIALLAGARNQIVLKGGPGVGTVTRPGLGLPIGDSAINPVPRRNIEENVREAAGELLARAGLEVTISVPDGEKMARKTLNSRLGIVGGISILGTTGIVHPYSTAAFRASVVQGVEIAANQGLDTVVLTTGGRTEKFAMRELPQLSEASFVQMGDFLRYALDTAAAKKIRHVVIGGMVGKLTKIAQGETITHAGRNPVDTGLVAEIAAAVGAPPDICAAIRNAETARYGSERMEELGLMREFHHELARRVVRTLSARYSGKFTLTILVCDFEGKKLAAIHGKNADA
jgi:cobalt-precorrin-5B (C1)-methyltransferase